MGAAKDADAFCVGTELDKTVSHEREWRGIISAVHQVVGSKTVTYAANWDSYERVQFCSSFGSPLSPLRSEP